MNTNDIWLIAGLGNPEPKYDGTRHNAGFAALDYLAGKWGISFLLPRRTFRIRAPGHFMFFVYLFARAYVIITYCSKTDPT